MYAYRFRKKHLCIQIPKNIYAYRFRKKHLCIQIPKNIYAYRFRKTSMHTDSEKHVCLQIPKNIYAYRFRKKHLCIQIPQKTSMPTDSAKNIYAYRFRKKHISIQMPEKNMYAYFQQQQKQLNDYKDFKALPTETVLVNLWNPRICKVVFTFFCSFCIQKSVSKSNLQILEHIAQA